ncbi:MAG: hypothetical protein N3A72_06520 [bacterium]|nr:hypothetical protein [bacterium]
MNKKYCIFLIPLILVLPFTALAAIRTVNSAGGADFTTISAAITASVAGDTIRIIGVGPYDEVITVDKPLTIEGYGVRPNVCVQQNAASPSAGDDGLVITGFSGTVVLRNLNVIPSLTTPPADDGILINPGATVQTLNVIMEGLVVTPNDGTNNPVTLDGLTEIDLTGKTPFGDDGMFITSGAAASYVAVSMVSTIFSNHRNAGLNDGIVCGRILTIGPGCVISYNNRMGVQFSAASANITIAGTPESRVKIIGNKSATYGGCYLFNGQGSIDQAIIANNVGPGIATLGSATPGGIGLYNVSNCIIANNGTDGIQLADTSVGHNTPLTINKVTFYNNGQSPIEVQAGNLTSTITVTDCIFAGNGSDNIGVNVYLNNSNTSNISNSALVLVGGLSYTLATGSIDGVEGSGITNLTNVINLDPQFASLDSTNPNFLNVTNFAYCTAGSGGVPLAGGARYTGALPLQLTPVGPIIINPGKTKDFSASGGTNNFSWSLSNSTVGSINTTAGSTVTFTAVNVGSVDLTVSDPGPPVQQKTVTINVIATSAPLFIDAIERKDARFELNE